MTAIPGVTTNVPGYGTNHRLLLRYLLILISIPFALYPLAFPLATSAHYEHWATSTWTPMLEYAYSPRPQNADVVIFGDSSAFIGIDPRLINASLGIRSVVLPDSVGSIPVTGDMPLRSYLAHNRPPGLIVLYFSPWNMDFGNIPRFEQFEGQEMLLRHGTWHQIADFARQQPTELLVFPFRLYSTFGSKMAVAILHHVDRERATEEALGHTDYPPVAPALGADCRIPDSYVEKKGTASVEELARRYSSSETRVLVYVAPIPACGNSAKLTNRKLPGLDAKPPRTLPAAAFAGDPYYAHVLPEFVHASTAQLMAAVQAYLSAEPPHAALPRTQ